MKKHNTQYIWFPFIIAISIVIGMLIQKSFIPDNSSLNNVFIYPENNKLNTILNYVIEDYVDSVSKPDIVEKTIPYLLENLDPHSIYIPAEDFQRMNEPLEGNFDGIGVQFNIQKDTIAVVKVIAGGPSQLVGLMDGDRIVKINDSLVAGVGISNDMVMKKLRGERGTKVNVGIARKGIGELLDFTITRDKIPLYSVDVSYMINKETGYIKITKFAKTTYQEFVENINKLKKQNVKNIIVDLRGNTGGYLDAAINIADEFLEKGKLIVYTQGRARQKTSFFATSKNLCIDMNVTILIDEGSASASEIVSGAIQDNDRGIIIGRRSFGKGLVQEPTMFRDGSSIRLTTARYYTPTGRCIQKPYAENKEAYYHDLMNRYENGEFIHADSIHFPDSLKYKTPKGKIVYGGGGIMPDVFVPVDTTERSEYFFKISRKGLEYQFAFEYVDKNRDQLSGNVNIDQLNEFLDKNIVSIFNNFIIFCTNNDVPKDISGIKTSEKTIKIRLKALIARNIFDNEGFYPIIKDVDKTLLIAIERN